MEYIINKLMTVIKRYNRNENLRVIEYGLKTSYLAISKFIFFTLLALSLKIFKEYIIFLILFIGLRSVSFGIHANKSYICWIASFVSFIGLPIICNYLGRPNLVKIVIMAICIVLIYKNCPADTAKRPLMNAKKRRIYKMSSLLISFIYSLFAIIINNSFIFNSILLILIMDVALTSPITYKLLKQPYNNWKGDGK